MLAERYLVRTERYRQGAILHYGTTLVEMSERQPMMARRLQAKMVK